MGDTGAIVEAWDNQSRFAMEGNVSIQTRGQRLERLRRLRRMGAPRWVVRSEQVALVLNCEGLHHRGIGKPASQRQQELYGRFVTPCMGGE